MEALSFRDFGLYSMGNITSVSKTTLSIIFPTFLYYFNKVFIG